jgi:hypothetical protein
MVLALVLVAFGLLFIWAGWATGGVSLLVIAAGIFVLLYLQPKDPTPLQIARKLVTKLEEEERKKRW